MKKRRLVALVVALASTCLVVGCGGKEETSQDETSSVESLVSDVNSEQEESSSKEEEKRLPTKKEVVEAREREVEKTEQGYDFIFNLTGVVSALGYDVAVEANYDGAYRYNKETGALSFKRVTSGLLLYDSTEYVYSSNDQQIKVVMNEKNDVKKVEIIPNEELGLTLINQPIVAIIDGLAEENIVEVQESTLAGYSYETKITLASDNALLQKLYGVVGGLGANISLKGVTFDNPLGGISLYFNLTDGKLSDLKISTDVNVPIGGTDTVLTLTYEQKSATKPIEVPSTSGLILAQADVQAELNKINSAITSLKQADSYSLDIKAENQLDPAWNKIATTDSYIGRLYKNTVDGAVNFNHSYKYKAHHEEDGAEAYEYAVGNVTSGEVYLASYKGSNTYTKMENVTVDTQFDYMVAPILQKTENIDCLKTVKSGTTETYTLYLNKKGTSALQDTIVDLINSNEAEGVVDVNNYLASEYMIKNAEIVVVIENGTLKTVECLTELKYPPTGGEFTEYNVTLTNKISFAINENIDKAEKYKAPGKPDGFIDNLESIL
ncbi:MAG: hypothetical protein J6B05_03005 [Clostridia bacterium]|nr:hypothetical protein [Clostridia bacterium]